MEPPEHLRLAFVALQCGDHQMPCEYWPNDYELFDQNDGWDDWRKDRADEDWPRCARRWHTDLNAARHWLKLQARRAKVPSWCNQSEANLQRRRAWSE